MFVLDNSNFKSKVISCKSTTECKSTDIVSKRSHFRDTTTIHSTIQYLSIYETLSIAIINIRCEFLPVKS